VIAKTIAMGLPLVHRREGGLFYCVDGNKGWPDSMVNVILLKKLAPGGAGTEAQLHRHGLSLEDLKNALSFLGWQFPPTRIMKVNPAATATKDLGICRIKKILGPCDSSSIEGGASACGSALVPPFGCAEAEHRQDQDQPISQLGLHLRL
jgi:hypothetical protein